MTQFDGDNIVDGMGTERAVPALRASYEGSPGSWRPVIRRGKQVVWRGDMKCGNRDQTTPYNWGALNVAGRVLRALTDRDGFVASMGATSRWAGVAASATMNRWALAEADRIRAMVTP